MDLLHLYISDEDDGQVGCREETGAEKGVGQGEGAEGEERESVLGVTQRRIRPARGLIYRPDLDTCRGRSPSLHLPWKDPAGGKTDRQE